MVAIEIMMQVWLYIGITKEASGKLWGNKRVKLVFWKLQKKKKVMRKWKKKHPMFIDQKVKCCRFDQASQIDLQIQCNPC